MCLALLVFGRYSTEDIPFYPRSCALQCLTSLWSIAPFSNVITGPNHAYYHRLNGKLAPHVIMRYYVNPDSRKVLLWADVKSEEKKGMDGILATMEYVYDFLVHWNSTMPEAPMIDAHWNQYVSTIKRPSAVVSKVLPQQKPTPQTIPCGSTSSIQSPLASAWTIKYSTIT